MKTYHPKYLIRCILAAGLLMGPAAAQPAGRIVAIGDIHGAYDALIDILQRAELIDGQKRWTGGNAMLVQMGDCVDRGSNSRAVMDFLMELDKQSRGRVETLLGNHEMMNITGDMRYVSAGEFASFADKDSEKRREQAWRSFKEWRTRQARKMELPPPVLDDAAEKSWMEAHPLGFVEHRAAFSPLGVYGRWLRSRAAILERDGFVFVHAGLSKSVLGLSVKQINSRIKDEIQLFDSAFKYLVDQGVVLSFFSQDELLTVVRQEVEFEQKLAPSRIDWDKIQHLKALLSMGSWLSVNPEGPLWFRGFAGWNDQDGPANVSALLKKYGDVRFVVGHTPQDGGQIRSRFDGRILLIDTGMLSSYYQGGRASALEIQGSKINAIYPDLGRQPIP